MLLVFRHAMALVQLDNGVKVLPRFVITHQDIHHTYVVIGGAAVDGSVPCVLDNGVKALPRFVITHQDTHIA